MGAGASSREAALSSPEQEPAKCRQPKLQSISFRRCDLHASSGGTYHHRGASEVAAGAASPLAADETEAAGDGEDPAARLDRKAVEAWAADAVLLDLCGESLGAEGALGAISRDARRATADADWNALDEGRGRQHTGRVPPRRDASREALLGADDAFDLEDNARARPRSPEIVADNPLASLV